MEVPNSATVGFLKRAIGRALGGHLAPTLLRNHATREVLSDSPEDQALAVLGVSHNSYVLMVGSRQFVISPFACCLFASQSF